MERPFDYPGRHSDIVAPEPHQMVRAEGAGEIRLLHGDIGEYATTVRPYYVPDWWDAADIDAVVEERFKAERCQHEHDCCGHYYAGRGKVIMISDATDEHGDKCKLVLVRVYHALNV